MKKLRKFFVISVMVLSIIAMSGFTAPSASAAASAGDLIKMEGLSSVYYLGDDGKRYVFPNESTYFSWFADFSGVVTISATELQSYPLGGNVVMRPGTTLVKITTDPSVYAVEPNGVLRKIQSEAQATALYGINWNKRIVDLADSFFTNYTVGAPLADGQIPVGSLVKNAGVATVYYYDGTYYRAIASEAAMAANRLWMKYVMTVTNTLVAGGNALTGMEAALVRVNQGAAVGPVVTGSGLMVSLNANTPAAMNIPDNVSVEFMKLNLTAANDGPVNVSSITLTAYGLSNATNIDDVTFYDGNTKLGTSKDISSDRNATFNFATPIYVAAGSTKTLTVKATIAATSGSYGLGILGAAHIISSGATVSGSFPVVSNLMSAVDATVGQITITDNDVDVEVEFGTDDVTLADFTLTAGTEEDALVQHIALYNAGTNDNNIVSNLKLVIDGVEVANGVYADRYVTFTLNNYLIEKGDNVSVEVKGDVGITTDADTIQLYLKYDNDLVAVGKTQGFGLAVVNNFTTVGTVVTLQTGDFTIDMDKAATPAKDVKADDNDVVLATIKMTSNGENATLTAIPATSFYITTNVSNPDNLLENIEMRDMATGGIYDFTVSTTTNQIKLLFDDEISFVKGVTKTFQLRADIVSTVTEGRTFYATLANTGMLIEGDVSGATIAASPTSVVGSIITVKDASLTFTPVALTNTTVVGGAQDVVVYQAKVKAGTADGVKILSVKLESATNTATDLAFIDNNITKLELWLNGKLLKEASNLISGDTTGATETTITFSSLNALNYTVPAGAEYDLIVKADFASNLTAGDFELNLSNGTSYAEVTARSVDGNNTVNVANATTPSRLVTVADKGSLAVSMNVTDSKASRDSYILAGSQSEAGRYLGELKFTTTDEAIKVETLTLTASSTATAANDDIKAVKLVTAEGVVVASVGVDASGDAIFDPFDIVFDADKTTSLFIAVETKAINTAGDPTATADNGAIVQFEVDGVTATGVLSGEAITVAGNAVLSKAATIVGSKLISVVNSMTDGTLTGGTGKTLGKYTFVFDNGNNQSTTTNEVMKALLSSIKITFSSTATITNPYLYVEGFSGDQAASSTGAFIGGSVTWTNLGDLVNDGEVDGTITLVVAGQVTTTGENQYVQTSFANLAGGDISYDPDGSDDSGAAITNMLLPYTSVDGATLDN